MITGWVLLGVSLGYVALLFLVAYFGDRRPLYPERTPLRPVIYSLALAVYCSSWTFYGAVGTAAESGWGFLPIYLGPILLFFFGLGLMQRLVQVTHEQSITSIADFVGSRYGRSQGLAALVTIAGLVAAVPYLALQFKAGAMSIEVLGGIGQDGAPAPLRDPAIYMAVLLAVFSILFGTRQVDATEHHHGLMLAVALESLVKLVAFVAVGLFAWTQVSDGFVDRLQASAMGELSLPSGFVAQTLLAFLAIICLPRQFQVGMVECEHPADVRRARWLFPAYLLIVCVFVVPIALAGVEAFRGTALAPDTYVLMLPMSRGQEALALFGFLGGISAATGMVIVASVALATMVSNELVMPLLLRLRWVAAGAPRDLSRLVLGIRRITIVVLALAAYLYYRATAELGGLAQNGLLAFAAVAQFAPAIIGGLYWRGASRVGVHAGLAIGFLLWLYTLMLPTVAESMGLGTRWVEEGPFGLWLLRPHALFGAEGWDRLTHGVFWSLLFNSAAFLLLSLRYRPTVNERLGAMPFVEPWVQRPGSVDGEWQGRISVADLRTIAERIVGARAVARAFDEYREQSGRALASGDAADRGLLQHTERLLSASIGAASARRMLTTALRGTGMDLGEVVALLDETSQELRFNRALLAATLENITQGISVVDADMRLVAWNRRYLEMLGYPEGAVYVGRPVEDLIRWGSERGGAAPEEAQAQAEKRVSYMRRGSPHVYERVRSDGSVVETRGRAMPSGGNVTTYTDVTDYKRVESALIEANENLELRVNERTRDLSEAIEALRAAKLEAEMANLSKTRFLAGASHDLLQPINAARLFSAALMEISQEPDPVRPLAERIDRALKNAEELLDSLLETSRLDSGEMRPEFSPVSAARLAHSLHEQFAPLAAARGLALRVHVPDLWLHSDRRMLRRILQNFLANALRYTRHGGVLLALRQRGDMAQWQVWDTGPGIAPEHVSQVFEEFERLDQPSPWGEKGLGLGLSICERIAHILDHRIGVDSRLGRGSVFRLAVPLTHAPTEVQAPAAVARDVAGLRVLCVDNEPAILEGMVALLQRWGVVVETAAGLEAALECLKRVRPEVILADFHLGETLDGVAVLDILRRQAGGDDVPGALVTADRSEELAQRARHAGYPVLAKPVRPASLRALLAALARRRAATDASGAR